MTPSPASSAAPVNSPGPGRPSGSPGAGSTTRISSGCSLASTGSASHRVRSVQLPGTSATMCSSSPAISSQMSSGGTRPARHARVHATNRVDRRVVSVTVRVVRDMRARLRRTPDDCRRDPSVRMQPVAQAVRSGCMSGGYPDDVLSGYRRGQPRRPGAVPAVEAEPGLVVEDAAGEFCGAVVAIGADAVTLEDRHGRRRLFPLEPAGFRIDGELVTLVRPARTAPAPAPAQRRIASGSIAVPDHVARVARAGRIWVEGVHDAALVERIWGDDLRVEGVVVEPLHGIDDLPAAVEEFAPGPGRRLGVLVDHLVGGSK